MIDIVNIAPMDIEKTKDIVVHIGAVAFPTALM